LNIKSHIQGFAKKGSKLTQLLTHIQKNGKNLLYQLVVFIHKGLNKRVQILSMLVKNSSIAHSRWATDPILALTIYRMEMDEKMDGDGVLAMSGLGRREIQERFARFMMGAMNEHGGEKGISIRLQSQWSFGVNTLPPT
jgi:hypothetical protein